MLGLNCCSFTMCFLMFFDVLLACCDAMRGVPPLRTDLQLPYAFWFSISSEWRNDPRDPTDAHLSKGCPTGWFVRQNGCAMFPPTRVEKVLQGSKRFLLIEIAIRGVSIGGGYPQIAGWFLMESHDNPIYKWIWGNYNDLTTSSLEIMVSKGNHPQMALIQISELL